VAKVPDTPVPLGFDCRPDTRRDFLFLATGAIAATGLGAALWPLIDSMNPAADTRAVASIEINLAPLEPGQRITVKWRGKPVFIVRRTENAIQAARAGDNDPSLIDPERDADRVKREEWLVVVGVCTHLGCIPVGQKAVQPRGDWGGWFCPCHGSHYDKSGRIRKGPAPRNLVVPPYRFISDAELYIG